MTIFHGSAKKKHVILFALRLCPHGPENSMCAAIEQPMEYIYIYIYSYDKYKVSCYITQCHFNVTLSNNLSQCMMNNVFRFYNNKGILVS